MVQSRTRTQTRGSRAHFWHARPDDLLLTNVGCFGTFVEPIMGKNILKNVPCSLWWKSSHQIIQRPAFLTLTSNIKTLGFRDLRPPETELWLAMWSHGVSQRSISVCVLIYKSLPGMIRKIERWDIFILSVSVPELHGKKTENRVN